MRRGNFLIIPLLAIMITGAVMGIANAAGDTTQSDSTSSSTSTSSPINNNNINNNNNFNPTIVIPVTTSQYSSQAQAVGVSPAAAKPTADFVANKVSGEAPLSVQFTSITTGNPTEYFWIFEPSSSSDWNSHHPVTAKHTFKKPGVYTISLTVSNGAGSDKATKDSYIVVT